MQQRKTATTAIHQWTPISEIQFCAWVAQAIPGDRLEYHRGYLAVDADKVTSDLDLNARAELACLLRDGSSVSLRRVSAIGCSVRRSIEGTVLK